MTIFDIPNRTIDNPLLNMREANTIISLLRNILRGQRYKVSPVGIEIGEQQPDAGTVHVQFTSTVNPHSVFFVKYVSRGYLYSIPLLHSNTTTNYKDTKQSKGELLVTNGGQKAVNGSGLWCKIIGYDTWHLVKYTSTAPDVGDRLRPSLTGGTVFKHNAGELVACGKPDTTHLLVPVIRHRKKDKIYGKTAASVTYGSTVTINIWRNNAVTSPLETETGVLFNWLGVSAQVIPSGTKVEAEWWDDLNNGDGGYRISNSNCVAS